MRAPSPAAAPMVRACSTEFYDICAGWPRFAQGVALARRARRHHHPQVRTLTTLELARREKWQRDELLTRRCTTIHRCFSLLHSRLHRVCWLKVLICPPIEYTYRLLIYRVENRALCETVRPCLHTLEGLGASACSEKRICTEASDHDGGELFDSSSAGRADPAIAHRHTWHAYGPPSADS